MLYFIFSYVVIPDGLDVAELHSDFYTLAAPFVAVLVLGAIFAMIRHAINRS